MVFRRLYISVLCFLCVGASFAATGTVHGVVVGPDGPCPYVNVSLQGTLFGATTDAKGRFRIEGVPAGDHVLLLSSVGFDRKAVAFTLMEGEDKELGSILLVKDRTELEEVVVTGTMKEISRSDSPIPVEVITPKLFRRNPEPSLLGSIGMVNGVRPQLNCSVCNTGDIHINGMEGPYTLVLVDGMPIVSSLGTVYGLSGIPNSMVERIEVVKGPGGALYGSEAMGGVINVVTRDPRHAPAIAAEAYTSSWREANLDVSATARIGKVKGLLGLNTYQYRDPRDDNGDGFTDLTLQERYSLFAKADLQREGHRTASLAARYLWEDRWGGQMNWTPAFRGGDSIYGEAIDTRRWEVLGSYAWPLRERIITQVSLNHHLQDSDYGTMRFRGEQTIGFVQTYWTRKLGARHELLAGAALRSTRYNDNTVGTANRDGTDAPQHNDLPGLFVQDEWRLAPEQTLLLGYRLDHHPVHGAVHSPRLAYRLSLPHQQTLRASLGTGFRVVNLFTEDHAALTGSRQVVIAEELRPERSTGATVTYTRKWVSEKHFLLVDLTAWYTHFSDQIIGDFDTDPDMIIYANLNGHAVSQGISANVEAVIGGPWKAMAGVSYMDVYRVDRQEDGGSLRRRQLYAPAWSGTFTLGRSLGRWQLDLTGQWYGPMRLPVQVRDPRPDHSPLYAIMNMQVTHAFGNGLELFGGVKNLLDFAPRDVILRSHDPFDKLVDDPQDNPLGHTFDASYMYAPLQGIRGFFGLRWALQ